MDFWFLILPGKSLEVILITNKNRIKYNFSWICKKREDTRQTATPKTAETHSWIQGVTTYQSNDSWVETAVRIDLSPAYLCSPSPSTPPFRAGPGHLPSICPMSSPYALPKLSPLPECVLHKGRARSVAQDSIPIT